MFNVDLLGFGSPFSVLVDKTERISLFLIKISSMFKWLVFFLLLVMGACSTSHRTSKQANLLAHKYIIADGHVDLPYRLKVKNFRFQKEYVGIPLSSKEGDFDFVRAKKGGLSAPFMSIYIPAHLSPAEGRLLSDSLIQMVKGIGAAHPFHFAIAHSPQDVNTSFSKGLVSLPMGMENGSPISTLADLKYFKNQGISYITLTHSKSNAICDSSYDTLRPWTGLSPFGFEVVREMNRLGIMIDVSHISDSSFWDVMHTTKAPVIASHSSARKFTPGFERNMSDDLIRAMRTNGGVIMVNFGSDFVDGNVTSTNKNNETIIAEVLKRKNIPADSDQGKAWIERFRKQNPRLYADVEKVADHIDHIVSLAGIDHVGFGSDFDGVGDSLPNGLKDVSDYPNLIASLLRRGYTENDIEKICYKNLFRVWEEVLTYNDGK